MPQAAWEDISGTLVPTVATGWVGIVRPDRTVVVGGPPDAAGAMVEQVLELFGAQLAEAAEEKSLRAVA
jgi:hypothetical protein